MNTTITYFRKGLLPAAAGPAPKLLSDRSMVDNLLK